jgi:hypothetical protein
VMTGREGKGVRVGKASRQCVKSKGIAVQA